MTVAEPVAPVVTGADPEVTSGSILVGVENPPDSSLTAFEQALSAPPGARIKKI